MKHNIFLRMHIILLIGFALVLQSCSTCDPGSSLYVRGAISVRVTSSGALEQVEGGETRITLDSPGESYVIEQDRPFMLDIPDAIDLSSYALVVNEVDSTVPGARYYRISLRESCQPYIVMDKRCKIVNWYNPYRLPEVRIQNAYTDQLVTTPILGKSNEIIGYEVRLGDAGDGSSKTANTSACPSPALKRLQQFQQKDKAGYAGLRPVKPRTKKEPMKLEDLISAVAKS
jgi:hypothetical protein